MATMQFIHQDPKSRTLSAADRRTVRKVSNTAGAATRKARGVGLKVNTLQIPDFLVYQTDDTSNSSETTASSGSSKQLSCAQSQASGRSSDARSTTRHVSNGQRSRRPGHDPPVTAALSLWPDYDFPEYVCLLMEPGLSTRLLIDASAANVNSDPRRWVKICRLTSILRFLPQMIGYSKCLDHAIDCLAERVRQRCVASTDRETGQTHLERRYVRALQSLQGALDAKGNIDWTSWYSTMLLALFELLEGSTRHAWILHSHGGKHILLAIGPQNIKTEYHKLLLAAQCPILTIEAIFINKDCYLSSPAWQRALRSTILEHESSPDRSEAVVTMWMITAHGPGLFKRVTDAVLHRSRSDQNEKLAEELCRLLEKFSKWRDKWEQSLLCEDFPTISDVTLATAGPTIYPQYLAFWALTNRFLTALQPHRAPETETNAINAALRIIEFDELRETDSVTDLCRTFSANIARSIKATTMDWTMQQYASRSSETIEPAIFLRWTTLLGRSHDCS